MDKPKNIEFSCRKMLYRILKVQRNIFRYKEYAENFSKKIKSAIRALDPFAEGYKKTGYVIDGLKIYYKPYSTYLIFFVVEGATVTVIRVLKDRVYWQAIINRMRKINK